MTIEKIKKIKQAIAVVKIMNCALFIMHTRRSRDVVVERDRGRYNRAVGSLARGLQTAGGDPVQMTIKS
jgi:hypothetical protein